MELEPLLDAHARLRLERPPLLWEADAKAAAVARLIDEMIAAALVRGTEVGDIVLNVNNVTVEDDEGGITAPAPGDYVALSVLGAGDWRPEVVWRPREANAPTLVSAELDAAARGANVAYGYSRAAAGGGSVTVFLERLGGL